MTFSPPMMRSRRARLLRRRRLCFSPLSFSACRRQLFEPAADVIDYLDIVFAGH